VNLKPDIVKDPDMFEIVRILSDDKLTQDLLKEFNLRPRGTDLPNIAGPGHPVVGDYFGVCSELIPKFNTSKPDCRGKVTTKTRKSKKNEQDILYYYQYAKNRLPSLFLPFHNSFTLVVELVGRKCP
jgi:hypothetical protein